MQHTKGRLLSLKSIFCGKQCLWKSDKNLWPTKQNPSICYFISTNNLLQNYSMGHSWIKGVISTDLVGDLILLAKGDSCTGRISAFGLDSTCSQNKPRTDILTVWSWTSLVTEIGDLLYNWECLEKNVTITDWKNTPNVKCTSYTGWEPAKCINSRLMLNKQNGKRWS